MVTVIYFLIYGAVAIQQTKISNVLRNDRIYQK